MKWSWASTCGTVSAPTNTTGSDTTDGTSKVTFTAPTTGGVCVVDVTLTDAAGVLKNVASVAISVNAGAGNAKIVANLDTYPVITGLTATPIPLVVGTASTLTVTATDSDGNTLYYNWTSTCPGTFGTPTLATTTFIPSTTTLTSCTFSAVVNDGNFPDGTPRGGVITNSITLPIGGPTVLGAPVIGYDYQTSSTITTGEVVNMAIVATEGCSGGTLTFNWTASDGYHGYYRHPGQPRAWHGVHNRGELPGPVWRRERPRDHGHREGNLQLDRPIDLGRLRADPAR